MMTMVDNYEAQLSALKLFVKANCPADCDRGLHGLEERPGNYIALEFRRGDVSCTLYIELDAFSAVPVTDDEGNYWRQYTLVAKPSWPAYGSVSVAHAQAFVKLVGEVTAFADSVMKEFSRPITKLVETRAEIASRKVASELRIATDRVLSLMRTNAKGMRVGQQRRVELPADNELQCVGKVVYTDPQGRQYTTLSQANRAFYFTRTA